MKKFVYRFEAMSTPCELILYSLKKEQAEYAAQAVLAEVKRLENKYNYYSKTSFLSSINSRECSELDQESKTLLSRAKQYYKLTDGVFDITIATIKELYSNESDPKKLEEKKSDLMQYVGCEHFNIKRQKIVFDNAFTKIDLGGFVKEYAVDRAVSILKKRKILSALVNFGGDIYALGSKPDGTHFQIGIKDPKNREKFVTEVTLLNQSLTTSASYERNFQVGKKTYSHIISKVEITNKPLSVSVIANSCIESGVYSTSLMINKEIQTKNRVIFF